MDDVSFDFFLDAIATKKCNFQCMYCINGLGKYERSLPQRLGDYIYNYLLLQGGGLVRFLNRQDKVFLVNFSGGEPFTIKGFTHLCGQITKKHYICLLTNGVLPQTRIFADNMIPDRVKYIILSCHFLELARRHLLETYADNFIYLRTRGFIVSAHAVAHPLLIGHEDDSLKFLRKQGIDVLWKPFVGEYNGKSYPEAYTSEEKVYFGLSQSAVREHYIQDRLCNAGHKAAILTDRGMFFACTHAKEDIGSVYKGLRLSPRPIRCSYGRCDCPLDNLGPQLRATL
jgi:MoaA/NifB/PqqE/SkfB family radical SAM enzyme